MDAVLHVDLKCSQCGHSLMNPQLLLDGQPSIDLQAKVRDRLGHIYLSRVFGSYAKQFSGVADIPGSVAEFSCPHCHNPFPVTQVCECHAPVIGLHLEIGGLVKFCTRNGCRRHWLEFEDAEEVFELFEAQAG